jgi:hypothetical protein
LLCVARTAHPLRGQRASSAVTAMPPRRSARVAAVVERESSALPPLPLPLVHKIFLLLPAAARARAACVCHGWRVVIDEPRLWSHLALSAELFSAAVLRGAAARARGALHTLDLSAATGALDLEALLVVVGANAGALRALHLPTGYCGTVASAVQLLAAAPHLRELHASVTCGAAAEACSLLRQDGIFAPLRLLRLRQLHLDTDRARSGNADLARFAAALAQHTSLRELEIFGAPLAAAATADAAPPVEVLVTGVLGAPHVHSLILNPVCRAMVPALVRLLRSSATLTRLDLLGDGVLLDEPTAVLLGAALRENSTLQTLTLHNMGLFQDAPVTALVLGALTRHASMRKLHIRGSCGAGIDEATRAACGAALGALVAADAPALTHFALSYNFALRDAGLTPVLQALRSNTRLTTLRLQFNGESPRFAEEVLLPCVRANSGLRQLRLLPGLPLQATPFLEQACALVEARSGAAGAAAA